MYKVGAQMSRAASPNPAEDVIHRVSHDLRGPLLNFQGFLRRLGQGCELLRTQAGSWNLSDEQRRLWDQVWDQKVRGSLHILEQNAQRMGRLLAALLAVSRAGLGELQPQWLSTEQTSRRLAEDLKPSLDKKRATLVLGSTPPVWTDPSRFGEILRQLLTNAFHYLSPDRPGVITLEGAISGPEVVWQVRDNGIGIRPEDEERIFLPLERVREIEAPGEGVGLAIARKLAEQLGGRIWVESVHRQGSAFYLALPRPPAPPRAGGP